MNLLCVNFGWISSILGRRKQHSGAREETLHPEGQTTVELVETETDQDKARTGGAVGQTHQTGDSLLSNNSQPESDGRNQNMITGQQRSAAAIHDSYTNTNDARSSSHGTANHRSKDYLSATQAVPAEPFSDCSASSAPSIDSETSNRSRVSGREVVMADFHNGPVVAGNTHQAESSSPPNNPNPSLLSAKGGAVEVHGGQFNAVGGHQFTFNINTTEGVGLQSNPANRAPTANPTNDERLAEQARPRKRPPTPSVQRSCDIYYRQMGTHGRGSALWIPEPNQTLPPAYQRRGTGIGDVGILTAFGGFAFLFSICLPPGHPMQSEKLPKNFVQFFIDQSDVDKHSEFKNDGYLVSASVERSRYDGDSSGLIFESSASEGAILMMPVGANSEDLGNVFALRRYVKTQVTSWYEYAYIVRGREVLNGDLRLVIGYDKAKAWGMATFENATAQQACKLEFIPALQNNVGRTYHWKSSGSAHARVGPEAVDIEALRADDPSQQRTEYENQSLFIRTMNITLADKAWKELALKLDIQVDVNSHNSNSASLAVPRNLGRESSSTTGNMSASTSTRGNGVFMKAYHAHVPEVAIVGHPSKAINQMLLEYSKTNIRMVITEDKNWTSMLNPEDRVLPSAEELCARVKRSSVVNEDDGVIFLEPKKTQNALAELSEMEKSQPSFATESSHWEAISNSGASSSLRLSSKVLKSIAVGLLHAFWPDDSPDIQYQKAEAAYQKAEAVHLSYKTLSIAWQDYIAHSARIKEEYSELANTEVNYAAALWAEYELNGQLPEKLTRIIELNEHALGLWKAISSKPDGYPVLLLNLFTAYFHSYLAAQNQGSKDSLNLELYDELKQYSQQSDVPNDTRRKMLMMLGTALSTRCDLEGTSDKLDEAINYLKEALNLSKPSEAAEGEDRERGTDLAAFHGGWLLKLATAYMVRYQFSKDSQDLDDAIRYNGLAREALPNEDPDRALCLYNLAHQLFKRYEQAQKKIAGPVLLDSRLDANKGMEDLKEAERTAGEAQRLLEIAPPESELKQLVNEFLEVVKVHIAASSRVPSRAPTPTPSPHPSDVRGS